MTYPSYHTSFTLVNRDAKEIIFRQLLPSDTIRMQKGFFLLSENSVYRRFFTPVKYLNEAQLLYLTNVDQTQHIAWGALSPDYPQLPGLGTCRFIKKAENPKEAELAITIIDAYQNKGLGSLFLALLYLLAQYHAVEVLYGTALSINHSFVKRFKNIGANVRPVGDSYELTLPVLSPDEYTGFPQNDFSRLFQQNLHTLKALLDKQ